MNDSLSIDEIIKQAEEIREKTVKKAQSALEDVNNSAKEITEREIEVPKPEPENIKIASKSDKFSKFKQNEVADKTKVSPAIKVDDKTKHIEFKPKSNQIDRDFEEQKR
jgi:Zn-dependent metalloprotease